MQNGLFLIFAAKYGCVSHTLLFFTAVINCSEDVADNQAIGSCAAVNATYKPLAYGVELDQAQLERKAYPLKDRF